MLTVSLVGKKFSCSIQLQISAEKEGGGLELALKAGEKCTNRSQSLSNINASLNITIQSGCSNNVTKCKEMLMFLQEQALPKTMNIMKVHMVNKEMSNIQKADSRLFSCIKQKKRERERSTSVDRLSSRGYSSDSEQVSRGHIRSATAGPLGRMDILATPRMSRHKLKNAALLRDRRNREASKERTLMNEKSKKESKTKKIELHLKDSTKNKKNSSKKIETEYENEGSFKYEGGSESSLCEASLKTNAKSIKDLEDSEISDSKEYKATESDMSVDSLECLDIDDTKIQDKKKKGRRTSSGLFQQADRKSGPLLVPPLVLPDDSEDTSTELSDSPGRQDQESMRSSNLKEYQETSVLKKQTHQTTETNQLALTNISPKELSKILRKTAQQIVQEVICSALNKCEKGTSLLSTLKSFASFQGDFVQSVDSNSERKRRSKCLECGKLKYEIDEELWMDGLDDSRCKRHSQDDPQCGIRSDLSITTPCNNCGYTRQRSVVDCERCKSEEPKSSTPRSTQTSPQLSFNDESSSDESKGIRKHPAKVKTHPKATSKESQGVQNYPVKIYDTHENITKRIITSVSRALHFKPKYVTPSHCHSLTPSDVPIPVTQPNLLLGKDLKSTVHCHAYLTKPCDLLQSSSTIEKGFPLSWEHDKIENQQEGAKYPDSAHGSLIEEFCKSLPYTSKTISYKTNNSKDNFSKRGYCFFVIGPENDTELSSKPNTGLNREITNTGALTREQEFQQKRRLERPKSAMYRRSLSDQNERRKWSTATSDTISGSHHGAHAHTVDINSKSSRANKCVSCPVLSEEDIALEGLESHHQDVCNSLSQRTWIVLRVHELWKANKPLEALTTCMELTGIKTIEADTSGSSLDMSGNRDIVLFLNILQQLPSSCSTWSLGMCELLLPELKLFISTRIHTSHVDMACNVLLVIVKKVNGAVLKAQTANKEKSDVLKKCVSHLQDIKDKASQVLMAKRGKARSTLSTEDPIALKPVLRELLAAIQTLLNVYIE